MAYMNQEKKAAIAAALKLVMPKGWKYSLSVRNHSTIVCTISAAPVDLLANWNETTAPRRAVNGDLIPSKYVQVNTYHVRQQFSGDVQDTMSKIVEALNLNNHDNSDFMTDYFDVGHYVDLNIGKWNKAFVLTAA